MADSVTSKVSVFVRCRPLSTKERMGRRCLTITKDSVNVGDKPFNFEAIFGEDSTQSLVYESCVKDLVAGCFRGYNGTVFAYGQTGSGKTHTIMGTAGVDDEEGIIPRAVKDIFHTLYVDKAATLASANIRVSMMEIYNDDVKDLLHPDIPSRDIMIREDKDGRIFFTGAREEAVPDVRTAMFYLEQGNLNRSTAETLMNMTSSRSHAIFTISIETLELSEVNGGETQREGQGKGQAGSYVQAKLHLVDLAGSERAKRTGAVGTRLKESVGINQGLLSLGKVIRALTTNGSLQHVPYRESKLTRFLQDSLGGNSRTVMLACISSAECNLHETLSTLQYAYRAKAVQNKLSANVSVGLVPLPDNSNSEFQTEMESSVIVSLRNQIAHMQTEISRHSATAGIALLPSNSHPALRDGLNAQEDALIKELREENENSQRTLQRTVRVLGKIQHTIKEHLRHLETTGGNTAAQCGAAWHLVNVCETVVSTLEELQHQGQLGTGSKSTNVLPSRAAAALRSSLNESISGLLGGAELVPNLTDEVAALRSELEECREDLKRDEDIFAEKVKELKRCRKRIRELEVENRQLMEKNQTVQSQVQRLATTLINQQRQAERRAHRKHLQSLDPTHPNTINSEGDVDDLDISVAVAVTEPDISQLMEDLETMAREKEDLLADNLRAKDHVSSAQTLAQAQRDEYHQGQLALKERLSELEESIHHKEKLIHDLTTAQSDAQQQAVLHQERARAVEAESRRLREQLRELDGAKQASVEEVSEEREKRRQYEARLRVAEEQLQQMEMERKEFMASERQKIHSEEKQQYQEFESHKAAEHLQELETFKAEYARLTAQIDQAENKQRKTLEHLTHQIDQYKKKSIDSARQIKILEEKNVDLRNRLERLTNAKRKTGHDDALSDQAEAKTSDRAGLSGTGTNGVGAKQDSAEEAQMSAQAVGEWIRGKVEDIVEFRNAKNELERLQHKQASLQAERSGVESELKPIILRATETEAKLKKKVAEIGTKIASLQDKKTALQRRIAAARARNIESPELLQELEDLQESIDSYQEHQREYTDRIHRGGLDDALLNQKQDLLEELETIHTEIELNQARMAHENLRLNKLEDIIAASGGNGTIKLTPLGVDRPLATLPSDEDCFNALMHELKRNVMKTDNARSDAKLEAMLKELVSTIVQQKTQTSDNSASIKQLQQQLDDKIAENEELVRTMQKSRTEAIRRQDQQKREADDKIAFLLHQLRSAESRRVADDNHSVGSGTGKLNHHAGHLSARSDVSQESQANKDFEGFAFSVANRNSSTQGNTGTFSRPSSASVSAAGAAGASPGWGQQPSSTLRASVSAGGARPPSDSMLSELARLDPRDVNKEIERRWTAEKERREQLEKRNAEMVRELKQLRAEVAKNSGR